MCTLCSSVHCVCTIYYCAAWCKPLTCVCVRCLMWTSSNCTYSAHVPVCHTNIIALNSTEILSAGHRLASLIEQTICAVDSRRLSKCIAGVGVLELYEGPLAILSLTTGQIASDIVQASHPIPRHSRHLYLIPRYPIAITSQTSHCLFKGTLMRLIENSPLCDCVGKGAGNGLFQIYNLYAMVLYEFCMQFRESAGYLG